MSEQRKQVVVDITIGAPIETVWAALREPARIATWFGWDAPSLAEEIDFIFVKGAAADVATHVIQFDAWEGASDAIELTQEGGATRLRLIRSGGGPLDWDGVYEDVREGWVTFFQQLRLALERHRDAPRRTLYLSGAAKPGRGEPRRALGLLPVTTLAEGSDYALTLATGEAIAGAVWYRTHFQTALTVDEWGGGLLVVSDMGVSPKRPSGGGSVLLTTYGLSDDAFAALQRLWHDWWQAYSIPPAG